MDRRQFLIWAGAIAGQLLVPRFFDRALAFVENHDEPLTVEGWELEPHQLDQPMDKWAWEEHWWRIHSPHGRAWDYLHELDLGSAFGKHPDTEGEIRFIDGPMPGSPKTNTGAPLVSVETKGSLHRSISRQ